MNGLQRCGVLTSRNEIFDEFRVRKCRRFETVGSSFDSAALSLCHSDCFSITICRLLLDGVYEFK